MTGLFGASGSAPVHSLWCSNGSWLWLWMSLLALFLLGEPSWPPLVDSNAMGIELPTSLPSLVLALNFCMLQVGTWASETEFQKTRLV